MKKTISTLLLMSLVTLSPLSSLAQQQYHTLDEVREQAAERWTQTYQTKWRDISIDVQPAIPDVDQFPVLKLGYGVTEPVLTPEESGWDVIRSDTPDSISLYMNDTAGGYVGKKMDIVADRIYYDGFAPDNTYQALSDITLGEMCDRVREELVRFQYDPDDFWLENPKDINVHRIYKKRTQEDAMPGYLFMSFYAKMRGIPVYGHIFDAVKDANPQGSSDLWYPTTSSATFDGEQLTGLHIRVPKVTEVLAEDVPLCAFSDVLAAFEKEIDAGHVRQVFNLELGYVLYNKPGWERPEKSGSVYREDDAYFAVPMWKLDCLYVNSPRGEMRNYEGLDVDARNTLESTTLLVNAQTGEMVDRKDTSKTRCEFKGFLSWEDVGGSR